MGTNFLRRVIVQGPTTITGGRDDELTIEFAVRQWHSGTPNMANITVMNASPGTIGAWKNHIGAPVTLSAGYEKGAVGVIFSGTIKQVVAGHQTSVDSFMTVYCADSETWYRKQPITKTLPRGWTPQRRLEAVLETMKLYGITLGVNALDLSTPVYPRGTPLIGMAREHLREITLSAGGLWSVQHGKLTVTGKDLDDGNPALIDLTPQTGLIGIPRQSSDGVEFRCLLDATIQPLTKVRIDPSLIIEAQQNINDLDKGNFAYNQQLADAKVGAGTYTVYKVIRSGVTRYGQDWYNDCVAIGKGGILPQSAQDQYYSIGSQ